MKANFVKKIFINLLVIILFICCNRSNSKTASSNSRSTTQVVQESIVHSQTKAIKLTEADLILNVSKLALSNITGSTKKKQIKDSIRINLKEEYYALQIGPKLQKEDAIHNYKKIVEAGFNSIYIFSISKMENYVVLFQSRGRSELELIMRDLKIRLGDYGTEGLQIINLYDEKYCTSNEIIAQKSESEGQMELKYIVCEYLTELDLVF